MKDIRKGRSLVLAMIAIFIAINFADKAIIGLAAARIMTDTGITPADFGIIGSSFFFLFSLSAIVVGFLADRIPSKYVLMGLALIWSIAQLPVVFATSFASLMFSRILLGVGEGPAFPMAMHAVYRWFDNDERNIPTSIVQQGTNFGLMVAGPMLTWIILHFGWRAAFIFMSVIGVAWVVVWALFGEDGPIGEDGAAGPLDGKEITTSRVMLDSTAIATVLVYFVEYSVVALSFTWLPAYINLGLGYDERTTGMLYSVICGSWIPLNLLVVWCSKRLKDRGATSRLARGMICSAGTIAGGTIYMGLGLEIAPGWKIVMIALASLLTQFVFTFGPLVISEISPSNKRGGTLGLMSALGTLGGVAAPYVMGLIVHRGADGTISGFEHGYFVLSLMLIGGGTIGLKFIDPERSIARLTRTTE